jgi:hypothetical protein
MAGQFSRLRPTRDDLTIRIVLLEGAVVTEALSRAKEREERTR